MTFTFHPSSGFSGDASMREARLIFGRMGGPNFHRPRIEGPRSGPRRIERRCRMEHPRFARRMVWQRRHETFRRMQDVRGRLDVRQRRLDYLWRKPSYTAYRRDVRVQNWRAPYTYVHAVGTAPYRPYENRPYVQNQRQDRTVDQLNRDQVRKKPCRKKTARNTDCNTNNSVVYGPTASGGVNMQQNVVYGQTESGAGVTLQELQAKKESLKQQLLSLSVQFKDSLPLYFKKDLTAKITALGRELDQVTRQIKMMPAVPQNSTQQKSAEYGQPDREPNNDAVRMNKPDTRQGNQPQNNPAVPDPRPEDMSPVPKEPAAPAAQPQLQPKAPDAALTPTPETKPDITPPPTANKNPVPPPVTRPESASAASDSSSKETRADISIMTLSEVRKEYETLRNEIQKFLIAQETIINNVKTIKSDRTMTEAEKGIRIRRELYDVWKDTMEPKYKAAKERSKQLEDRLKQLNVGQPKPAETAPPVPDTPAPAAQPQPPVAPPLPTPSIPDSEKKVEPLNDSDFMKNILAKGKVDKSDLQGLSEAKREAFKEFMNSNPQKILELLLQGDSAEEIQKGFRKLTPADDDPFVWQLNRGIWANQKNILGRLPGMIEKLYREWLKTNPISVPTPVPTVPDAPAPSVKAVPKTPAEANTPKQTPEEIAKLKQEKVAAFKAKYGVLVKHAVFSQNPKYSLQDFEEHLMNVGKAIEGLTDTERKQLQELRANTLAFSLFNPNVWPLPDKGYEMTINPDSEPDVTRDDIRKLLAKVVEKEKAREK